MNTNASTIVVAREDFSIPGAAQSGGDPIENAKDEKQRFFDLLRESQPDVLVLNLTVTAGRGVATIQEVRAHSQVPILVVCAPADPLASDYQTAGAAKCLHPPVDIKEFNRSIQTVMGSSHPPAHGAPPPAEAYEFHGLIFHPDRRSIASAAGEPIPLTIPESDVLQFLASNSWAVCSREHLAQFAFGEASAVKLRAIGALVSQLRKKLEVAAGAGAGELIKTAPRAGYTLVADVLRSPPQESGEGP